MTKEQLAEMLNGRQYGDETTPEIERLAKENGLCIAFGASDDLLEFRGSVYMARLPNVCRRAAVLLHLCREF